MEAGGGKEATAGHRPLGSSNYLHSAGGFGTHLAAIYQQQQQQLQQQQQHHNHLHQQQQHQHQHQQQQQHQHQQQQQQQQQHHHYYHQHHPLLPHRATSGPPGTVQGAIGSTDGASNYPPSPHFASPSTIIHAPAATRPSPGHTLALPANPSHAANSPSSSYLPDGGAVPPTPPPAIAQHHVTVPSQQIGTTMGASRSEPPKKKRGRPRKYVTDANGAALALLPYSPNVSSSAAKKGRTYGKKAQMEALGAAGQGFTPHIITIAAGEDVSIKIMSFLQHGSWGMCILSATGSISNVTLCQPATSGGTVTYEGRFEILSLSGSFLPAENGGPHSRTGGLSVSLAGPDGRVIGGGVAGLFIAASPVKVVVGTFLSESHKLQARGGGTHVSDSNETANESPLYVPMQQSSVQDHNSGNAVEDSPQYDRPTHIMPHHPIDWGGNQFDTDSRGDTDTTVPSPDYA